jgi:hypothetical protein
MSFTATLASISLGTVESISPQWSSPLDSMGYPDTPANEQEFYDMSGAQLTISIKGKWTGTTWSDGFTWIASMAALITGSQYDDAQSRSLSVADGSSYLFGGAINVIVESFEPTIVGGTQPLIEYSLKVNQQAVY